MSHYDYSQSPEEIERDRKRVEERQKRDREDIEKHPEYSDKEKKTLLLILRGLHDGLLTPRKY